MRGTYERGAGVRMKLVCVCALVWERSIFAMLGA